MREMGGITVEDSDIALDLELMGGNYNFILLVNCESGLKKIREEHTIPDPETADGENRDFHVRRSARRKPEVSSHGGPM